MNNHRIKIPEQVADPLLETNHNKIKSLFKYSKIHLIKLEEADNSSNHWQFNQNQKLLLQKREMVVLSSNNSNNKRKITKMKKDNKYKMVWTKKMSKIWNWKMMKIVFKEKKMRNQMKMKQKRKKKMKKMKERKMKKMMDKEDLVMARVNQRKKEFLWEIRANHKINLKIRAQVVQSYH